MNLRTFSEHEERIRSEAFSAEKGRELCERAALLLKSGKCLMFGTNGTYVAKSQAMRKPYSP